MKKTILTALFSLVFGLLGAFIFTKFTTPKIDLKTSENSNKNPSKYVNFPGANISFVEASKRSTPSVVFIKTTAQYKRRSGFGGFFDFDPFGSIGKVSSSGSGVIMSNDGYIVTNNHVINGADEITVTLNNKKKEYKATVIGTDPSTDLALIKIDSKNLPAIEIANSENIEVGEWVLAVGNPFNLNSTVTAGIVSAKGRNINIVNNQFPIESFIQTDAAINPGNSGGALVDLEGKLVGINTAIASKTGSYSGYGFAIPVNMVAKIVKDLIDFGKVQRGFIGAIVEDINATNQTVIVGNLENGVIVNHVFEDGPSDKGGIKNGDVITKIQGKSTDTKALYDEQLAYYRPGDKVTIVLLRSGKEIEKTVVLIDQEGNTKITKKNSVNSATLGAGFQKLTNYEKKKLGIANGVKITDIKNGLVSRLSLTEGFVITSFNDQEIDEPNVLISLMENANGKYKIEGVDANGTKKYFNFYGY